MPAARPAQPHPLSPPPLPQALLQLPAVLSLLWQLSTERAGHIKFDEEVTWGGILSSTTAIFFYLYACAQQRAGRGGVKWDGGCGMVGVGE